MNTTETCLICGLPVPKGAIHPHITTYQIISFQIIQLYQKIKLKKPFKLTPNFSLPPLI